MISSHAHFQSIRGDQLTNNIEDFSEIDLVVLKKGLKDFFLVCFDGEKIRAYLG